MSNKCCSVYVIGYTVKCDDDDDDDGDDDAERLWRAPVQLRSGDRLMSNCEVR